ncbi:GNAT family N-acetyltransferase [uncultured Paludibaculum sp.]|uniref:GNAT family N-acetyltransferase n=1 Tax=uncultured Paludibaculum sp. TaxID=1765020 RepID=UPI002AABD4A6|nr:GNAT family N-acetyltransferase [uncultured Paludibaculum sp.]
MAETTDHDTFADAVREGRLWVALSGNRPVGFALVKMIGSGLPHLEEIDVDPPHGRRGLGTALVRTVCDWAAASGSATLTLTTFRAVPWNLPFYARLGFVEVPFSTLSPELAAIVAEEAHRGLDPATRAVMAYQCGQPLPVSTR